MDDLEQIKQTLLGAIELCEGLADAMQKTSINLFFVSKEMKRGLNMVEKIEKESTE